MYTALITGSSRGIGNAIAVEFARNGFNIILHGRDELRLTAVSNELLTLYPSIKVYSIAADLLTDEGIQLFIDKIHALNISLDVLVNNAGLFLPGTMMEESIDQFHTLWNVNMSSAYQITRALWGKLSLSSRAHVFNMCSIASITAYEAGGTYSLVKHALLGFSKSLRKEGMSRGIRVTAVLPGATLTDSWAGVDLPADRFMKPESIAKVCVTAFAINQDSVMEEVLIRPLLGDL
ncbi:MAG: SDR family NAD(P)-dependent oxidoreductase [Bacteroidota bacterium]|jgi:short-subunit dehydrogenase